MEVKTLQDYQNAALETAIYPREYSIIYPALGMNGEAGEVADNIKKVIRDRIIMRKEPTKEIILDVNTTKAVALEIGDVLWYCAVLANDLGLTLEEVAQMNVDKLRSRQQRNKLGGSGDER